MSRNVKLSLTTQSIIPKLKLGVSLNQKNLLTKSKLMTRNQFWHKKSNPKQKKQNFNILTLKKT